MCFLGYAAVAIHNKNGIKRDGFRCGSLTQGSDPKNFGFQAKVFGYHTYTMCGYSSVSCNVHDMPRHQRPTHTVQMLHTITPSYCITAVRGNEQKLANQTKLVVIGVRNITTIESTIALQRL